MRISMTESQQGIHIGFSIFMIAMALALCCVTRSTAQSPESPPREQLQQYVTQLQANPSDDALRTKIIQLALTLDPKPAIPAEALEHEGAAEYVFKHAQSPADFANAADEYEKALLLAPWNAGDYYNLGVCYDKEGDPRKAIAEYQFYLLAAPDAKDADQVTKQIGALKYELTQKEATDAAQRQREDAQQRQDEEQQREQAALQSEWSGIWRVTGGSERVQQFRGHGRVDNFYSSHVKFDVSGNQITERWCLDHPDFYGDGPGWIVSNKGHISGRVATFDDHTLRINDSGAIEDTDPSWPGEIPFTYSRVNDPGSSSSACPW